jgi:hypothetical protein
MAEPRALPAQAENSWLACARATDRAERRDRLPEKLLAAISRAESGRWDAASRKSAAWPWTVTSGTESWRFDTKAEAVRQVAKLQAGGRKNIDVGCMQINLFYHPDAFPNLERAFDPQANADYASRYLRTLRAEAGDWATAAANYHSRDPDRGQAYRARVVEHWRLLGGKTEILLAARDTGAADTGGADAKAPATPPGTVAAAAPETAGDRDAAVEPVPIDRERTERLNARFRDNRTTIAATQATERAEVRHRELDAWREAQVRGLAGAHEATMRRAGLAAERSREVNARTSSGRDTFSTNRARQLEFWRTREATGAPPP